MFEIVEAPTGRTFCDCGTCRSLGCDDREKARIAKGELRVDANLGSGNYANHYKLDHFLKQYRQTIDRIIESARVR